jgi:hypothetical protein
MATMAVRAASAGYFPYPAPSAHEDFWPLLYLHPVDGRIGLAKRRPHEHARPDLGLTEIPSRLAAGKVLTGGLGRDASMEPQCSRFRSVYRLCI